MNDDLRVALLIDADNLSGDVIEQGIEHLLKLYGAIHFRRAYSSPQKVIEHTELFKRYAIRPMVNVPTGKNSTDIALAVDAIDLAISERPDVVVIGSSDSDYAPLAQRLREKGCRVLGIGQAGKTGGEAPLAYDEFIDLAHRKSPRELPRELPRSTPAPRRPRARAPTVRAKAPVAAPVPAPPPAVPPEVASILAAVPALRNGAPLQLGEVSEALRRNDILTSKRASASGFLKRHAAYFELVPADRPRTVRYRGPKTE
ncbi:MAG TPA: NYN domain-containing protein [Burkholderiaceae bacterium]|nr:NYN domain-containing protein [Burkholderiaceae bacterium]